MAAKINDADLSVDVKGWTVQRCCPKKKDFECGEVTRTLTWFNRYLNIGGSWALYQCLAILPQGIEYVWYCDCHKCINYNEKTGCFDCGTCQKSYRSVKVDLAVCRLAAGGPWFVHTDVYTTIATSCYCRAQKTCSGNPFPQLEVPGLTKG